MNIQTFDPESFESCVEHGILLLRNLKIQLETEYEGFIFRTCLKSCRMSIDRAIINRPYNTTMMGAVRRYIKWIRDREIENNIDLVNAIWRLKNLNRANYE